MSRIYVASSWRNAWQPRVVEELRALGHDVYDFRNPAPGNVGFGWKQAGGGDEAKWPGDKLREVLTHPIARAGYALDIAAVRACEVCVLVLPCGRSANWEFGYAMGQGKRGVVVQFDREEPELMYMEASIVVTWGELRAAVPMEPALGRFGHHPDPAIDAEVECERLDGELFEARAARRRAVGS